LAPESETDVCPKGSTKQYREGKCEQDLNGNNYKCLDQPDCEEGTVLMVYSDTKKGYCNPCPKKRCRSTQFRIGECNGAVAGYDCLYCDENLPECNQKAGEEEYVAGECTVRVFGHNFALADAIGSHACSLEANTRVTNGIPLGSPLLLSLPS
jgi:hypothetical protein